MWRESNTPSKIEGAGGVDVPKALIYVFLQTWKNPNIIEFCLKIFPLLTLRQSIVRMSLWIFMPYRQTALV